MDSRSGETPTFPFEDIAKHIQSAGERVDLLGHNAMWLALRDLLLDVGVGLAERARMGLGAFARHFDLERLLIAWREQELSPHGRAALERYLASLPGMDMEMAAQPAFTPCHSAHSAHGYAQMQISGAIQAMRNYRQGCESLNLSPGPLELWAAHGAEDHVADCVHRRRRAEDARLESEDLLRHLAPRAGASEPERSPSKSL